MSSTEHKHGSFEILCAQHSHWEILLVEGIYKRSLKPPKHHRSEIFLAHRKLQLVYMARRLTHPLQHCPSTCMCWSCTLCPEHGSERILNPGRSGLHMKLKTDLIHARSSVRLHDMQTMAVMVLVVPHLTSCNRSSQEKEQCFGFRQVMKFLESVPAQTALNTGCAISIH